MNSESGGLQQPPGGQSSSGDSLSSPSSGDNFLTTVSNVNNINSDYQSKIDYNNKYKRSDAGPYFVYVESTDKNIGRLFPIRIGHYLKVDDAYKNSIVDIKIVGRNRVKVVLKSFQAANNLVNNDLLLKNGFISYIPKYYTHRKGIVRLVDTYFDENYLTEAIECDRKVDKVERMMKRVVNESGESELVKRQIIIVTFEGSTLPQSLRINGVLFAVEPYIYPVVQCMKCLAYGHVKALCKKDKELCKKCGEEHPTSTCDNESRYCVHCKCNEHSSTYRGCPYYQRQKRIKTIMSTQNVTFKEAEALEKNPSYAKVITNNRFEILNNLTNFPNLPACRSENTQLHNSISTPRVSTPTPYRSQRFLNNRTQANASQLNRVGQTQGSKAPPKKRKVSDSNRSSAPQPIGPVIPNPYRDEFMAYKEKLTDKLTTFFMSKLGQHISTDPQHMEIEELSIKENVLALIGSLFVSENPDNTDVNMSEDESFY